jgi:hypothetical protein
VVRFRDALSCVEGTGRRDPAAIGASLTQGWLKIDQTAAASEWPMSCDSQSRIAATLSEVRA